jgi:hypothetical protein
MLEGSPSTACYSSEQLVQASSFYAQRLLPRLNHGPLSNYPDSRSPLTRSFFSAIAESIPVAQMCRDSAGFPLKMCAETQESLVHFLRGTSSRGKQATEISQVRSVLHDLSMGQFITQIQAGDSESAAKFVQLSAAIMKPTLSALIRTTGLSLSCWETIREFYAEATRVGVFTLNPAPEGVLVKRQFHAAWQQAQSVILNIDRLDGLFAHANPTKTSSMYYGKEIIHAFISGEWTLGQLSNRLNAHTLQYFLHSIRGQLKLNRA